MLNLMENRRVPINVSVNPSEYSGRSIRLGNSDIRDKMNQRMREFEEESRKWRDQFLSSSSLGAAGPSSSSSSLLDRPRMFFNYPEFPELSSSPFGASSLSTRPAFGSSFPSSSIAPFAQSTHKSFMEEDDYGSKKYKIQFEIGDFKPNEIQVRTEGRQLIVKGDREIVAGGSTESKQFNREITLPDFIEPTSVTSFLSDGVLTVEAPVQLDRIGYTPSSSTSNTTSIRHSPFRDTHSPSRITLSNVPKTTTSTATMSASPFEREPVIAQAAPAPAPAPNTPAMYKFNMSEFRPEDIAITVTDTTLKVHAIREESDMRGSGKTYREFKREIGLPQGADVKRLKNSLQSDGTLSIEIPVVDNAQLRPPLSPTSAIGSKFSQFSLSDNNNNLNSNNSSSGLINSGSNSNLISAHNSSSSPVATGTGNLIGTSQDGKELKLTFDLTGYKPEDLSIKVIDNNTLKIHAVHIDNTRGNQIHREYTR